MMMAAGDASNSSVAAFLIVRPPIGFIGWGWESDDGKWPKSNIFNLQVGSIVAAGFQRDLELHQLIAAKGGNIHLVTGLIAAKQCLQITVIHFDSIDGDEGVAGGYTGTVSAAAV